MKSDKLLHREARDWVPPTIAKLAVGTETKAPVTLDQSVEPEFSGATRNAEPDPAAAPTMKFGFSLEWSFPLSARAD